MAVTSDVRKNFAIFVDGRGYAGQAKDFNAPKLKQLTEDFRAGGMLGPVAIAMGLDGVLAADFSLVKYDRNVLSLFGVVDGGRVNFVARELLESADGAVGGVVHTMRGKITELDPGTSEPGKLNPLKVTINMVYYKLEHGGQVVQEIDLENMVHVVGGVDQLAEQRATLGL
jgi:hypothetical protein